MLGLLAAVMAHNYVDRTALGLMLQSIKGELNLTDSELGLLTGLAFALFYSLMGIPIARWADRGNRVLIITLATALWSAAVVLSGTARTFIQLLLIRVGVAVGEAGCLPPAHSLIADYFTRGERPRAVAIYMLGGPIGILLGYLLAGWMNEVLGWRQTFVLLGLPGILLAMLTGFTLQEPRRASRSRGMAAYLQSQPGLLRTCITLWAQPTFRHLLLGLSVSGFFSYGILQWLPAFFIRTYGMRTGEVGSWLAAINGMGALLGTYLGGALAARYALRNERLQLQAMTVAFVVFVIFSAGVYLMPSAHLALGSLALAMIGVCVMNGPLYAIVQLVVPAPMRATAIALVLLFTNLIGMGLGPLTTGVMSDLFRPWAGEDSLRYALLALCPGYLWAAWHVWRASLTVAQDLEATE